MSLRDALTTFLVTGHITQIALYFRTHRNWFMPDHILHSKKALEAL